MGDVTLTLLRPSRRWSDLNYVEREGEWYSLDMGTTLYPIDMPRGTASVLVGAPMEGRDRVPVCVVYDADPDKWTQYEMSREDAVLVMPDWEE